MCEWVQVYIIAILYLSILYKTYHSRVSEPMDDSSSNLIKTVYEILDASFGISKFNQAIPLTISAVAVGISLVNRNFPKCMGHIIGGTIVALLSVVIIAFSEQPMCNQFSTAFVWYTVFYVLFCMQSSNNLDQNSFIGIVLGFIIIVFVDFITFMGGKWCENFGSAMYIGMMLLGIVGGIGGYYATQSLGGNAALYDFSGCSCDDCGGKCQVGSKGQVIMAKKLNLQ
jgi:hypothetical protein